MAQRELGSRTFLIIENPTRKGIRIPTVDHRMLAGGESVTLSESMVNKDLLARDLRLLVKEVVISPKAPEAKKVQESLKKPVRRPRSKRNVSEEI